LLITRKPSSFAEYDHVYSQDPAIDTESEDYDHAKWLESGFEKFLPLKPGQTPTVFRLRHLTAKEHSDLMDMAQDHGVASAAVSAFKRCLVKTSDFEFDRGRDGVPDDVVDAYYFAPNLPPGSVVLEVGLRIINEANPQKKS